MREEIYQLWNLSIPEFRVLLQAARIPGIYGMKLPEELTDKEIAQAVYRLTQRGLLKVKQNRFLLEAFWMEMLEYLKCPEQVLFFESREKSEFCFQREKNLYLSQTEAENVQIGFLEMEALADRILEHAGIDSKVVNEEDDRGDRMKNDEEKWLREERTRMFEEILSEEEAFLSEKKLVFLAGKSSGGGQAVRPQIAVGHHPFFYYLMYQREEEELKVEEYSEEKLRNLLLEMMKGEHR